MMTMVWGSMSLSTSLRNQSSVMSASSPTSPHPPISAWSPTSSTHSTRASSSSQYSPPRFALLWLAKIILHECSCLDLRGSSLASRVEGVQSVWRLDEEWHPILQFPGQINKQICWDNCINSKKCKECKSFFKNSLNVAIFQDCDLTYAHFARFPSWTMLNQTKPPPSTISRSWSTIMFTFCIYQSFYPANTVSPHLNHSKL